MPDVPDVPDPDATPLWGAGNVVLRPGLSVEPTFWGRVRGFLSGLLLTLVAMSLFVVFWAVTMRGDPMPALSADPSAGSVPTPAPTIPVSTFPAAFDGEWRGRGFLPPGSGDRTWTVKLNVIAGARTGRLELVELGCSGQVAPVNSVDGTFELTVVLDDDPADRCSPLGILWLTSGDPQWMYFSWKESRGSLAQIVGRLWKF